MAVPIGEADPPDTSGVYAFFLDDDVVRYVGEAKGSGGLRDRVLSKHVSGDDNHTLQREFRERFPDRAERRAFIRENVRVKWIAIDDPDRVAIVERLMIWLFRPQWNLK